jgi:large subunit ribosomal protein L9
MEVILLEPVRKVGNVGDVVIVKNGYARNYLIPAKKALRSTKDNLAFFESKKAEIEKENQNKTTEAEKIVKAIDGTFVTLITQAGEDGRLYGSVTPLDISRPLENIDRKQIALSAPIKYIGVYDVEVRLIGDISATIKVNVARTESEAKDAEKRSKAGEEVMEGPGATTPLKQAEEEKNTQKEEPKASAEAETKEPDAKADNNEEVVESKEEEKKASK